MNQLAYKLKCWGVGMSDGRKEIVGVWWVSEMKRGINLNLHPPSLNNDGSLMTDHPPKHINAIPTVNKFSGEEYNFVMNLL